MAYNAASLTPVHLCTTRDMQAHIGLELDSLPPYGYARSYPAMLPPFQTTYTMPYNTYTHWTGI
jgi:hypothetical protein